MSLAVAARAAFGLAWRATPGRILLRCALTIIAALAPVVAAWLMKTALDDIVAGRADVFAPLVGLVVCGVLTGLSAPLTSYVSAEIDRRVTLLARGRLFDAVGALHGLTRLEDPAFHNRLRLAEASGTQAPGMTVTALVNGGGAIVATGGFVIALARVSWVMTVVVLVCATPAVIAELRLSRKRARMLWAVTPVERREMFYSQLLLDPQAAKELRLFGLTRFFAERMRTERRRANAWRRSIDRRELATQGGVAFGSVAVGAGGLVWAVTAAAQGRLSVGDVALFVAAVASLQAATTGFVGMLSGLHHDLVMFENYLAVERTDPDVVDADEPRELLPLRCAIEFRDVWFRYGPDSPWVLRGVSFRIPAGAAVGLVGRNGAGKSTLVKLLCRLYEPTRGTIVWDGVDIRDVSVAALRSRIGTVFQDFMAYELTARENIAVGDLSAFEDEQRIVDAARHAGIHGAVTGLPGGYHTLLSRMFVDEDDTASGTYLSGGQWQKLATARALMRADRDLLVLDEPSSGLDAEAEHTLGAQLRTLRAGRATVLVSHRLGALRDADLIVGLDGGRVVETGDHESLSQHGGLYATLFRIQASGYIAQGVPA